MLGLGPSHVVPWADHHKLDERLCFMKRGRYLLRNRLQDGPGLLGLEMPVLGLP